MDRFIQALLTMLAVIAVHHANVIAQVEVEKGSKMPRVTVRVKTVTGAPIENLTVVFEDHRYLYKFRTGFDGWFSTTLPPGTFKVRAYEWIGKISYANEAWFPEDCKSYFRSFMRSDIKIENNDDIELNIVLIESGCVDWSDERQGGAFQTSCHGGQISKVQYEAILYGRPDYQSFDLIIQYGKRTETKRSVVYGLTVPQKKNLIWGEPHPGVMLTHNRITIYANRVEHDKIRKIVSATGNVVVDDGKKPFRVEEIIVRLADRPVFEYKKRTDL